MKCYICDATLSAEEIEWNRDHKDWDPCRTCINEINDIFDDPLTEEELDKLIEADLIALGLLEEGESLSD